MRGLTIGACAAALLTCAVRSEAAGYKVLYNEPDDANLHIAGSVYYALIAQNFLNYGLHGQATLNVAPALELQGTAMLNLPGSGIGLIRVEGSAFLAATYMKSTRVILSSSSDGRYVYTEYITVPDLERGKFGLEAGMYFDRHDVRYYDRADVARGDDPARPVTSLGGFAGLKWVTQADWEVAIAGRSTHYKKNRSAYYVHVMRALTQGLSVETGKETPTKFPWGARFGMEARFTGETGFFLKGEFGMMPSVRGPDLNMFIFLGAQHARALF